MPLKLPLSPRLADLFAMLFLILLPPLFFWRETLGWLTLGDQDAIFWFFPAYKLVAEQLRAGHLPLWNPYLYSGMPLFAQWQAGVLDPINWVYLLGVTSKTLTLAQEASFVISLLSTFGYARALGLKRQASVVAAVIYALSGFAVGRTIYPGLLHAVALVPLVLFFIERIYQRRLWRDVVGGGLIVAWQVFVGHPQPFVYSSLLAASYAIFCAFFRCPDPPGQDSKLSVQAVNERAVSPPARPAQARCLAQYGVMFLAGAGLSAVQLLPAWEFAGESVRQQVPYPFFTLFSLHPLSLLTTLFPFFHGQGRGIYHLPYWGPYWHQNEAQIYLGALALSLTVAGALCAWRERLRVGIFWSTVVVVAMAFSMGKYLGPVAWGLYRVPLLSSFRSPNRHWMEVTLGVAVLAGYAVDRLLRDEARLLARDTKVIAGGLSILIFLAASLLYWRREVMERVIRVLPDLHSLEPGFLQQAGAELYLPMISAASAFLVLTAFGQARHRHHWFAGLLALLVIDFNHYAAFAAINNPAKLESLIGQALPLELAKDQGGLEPLRYHLVLNPASGEFSPFWFYGYEMATGYDPLVNQRYKTFSGIDEAGRSHLRSMLSAQDRTLDLLNVRYILVSQAFLDDPSPDRSGPLLGGRGAQLDDATRWREIQARSPVAEYQTLRIYENLRVLPRAWLVSRVEPLAEDDQLRFIRGEIKDKEGQSFDPKTVALLEPETLPKWGDLWTSSAGYRKSPGSRLSGEMVKILKRTPTALLIEATVKQPAILVLSEVASPGWRAKVNGQGAEVWRVDYLLRGVALLPGTSIVELAYKPFSLRLGAVVSGGTILVLVLVLAREKRKAAEEREMPGDKKKASEG